MAFKKSAVNVLIAQRVFQIKRLQSGRENLIVCFFQESVCIVKLIADSRACTGINSAVIRGTNVNQFCIAVSVGIVGNNIVNTHSNGICLVIDKIGKGSFCILESCDDRIYL